jgi:hypothetical protein
MCFVIHLFREYFYDPFVPLTMRNRSWFFPAKMSCDHCHRLDRILSCARIIIFREDKGVLRSTVYWAWLFIPSGDKIASHRLKQSARGASISPTPCPRAAILTAAPAASPPSPPPPKPSFSTFFDAGAAGSDHPSLDGDLQHAPASTATHGWWRPPPRRPAHEPPPPPAAVHPRPSLCIQKLKTSLDSPQPEPRKPPT